MNLFFNENGHFAFVIEGTVHFRLSRTMLIQDRFKAIGEKCIRQGPVVQS